MTSWYKTGLLLCVIGLQSACSSFSEKPAPVAPAYVPPPEPLTTPAPPLEVQPVLEPLPPTTIELPVPVEIPKNTQGTVATYYPPTEPESPVILALMSQADESRASGDIEAAAVTIERALRIEPRNAKLVYQLAGLRLQQGQPSLAEDLAKKSALLAGSDNDLKRRSWLLVAESCHLQGKPEAAAIATEKAAQLQAGQE